jgi:hypothetical protein
MNAESVAVVVSAMIPVISPLVAVTGLYFVWKRWRNDALRTDDVLAWANETISALQSIVLICELAGSQSDDEPTKSRLTEVAFSTSILIERGRLFFLNEKAGNFGEEKEAAYRGYRPMILDPILVAHQIARAWGEADKNQRSQMRSLAVVCLKKFVSLAQKEVGRNRTASSDTRLGGDGIHLRHLIDAADTQKRWSKPFDSKG